VPLRTSNGQPIPLPAPAGQPPPTPIKTVYQEVDLWCWAACIEMVLHAAGSPIQQCQVASFQLQQHCCPAGSAPNGCKVAIPPADLADLWQHFLGHQVFPACGPLNLADLLIQLDVRVRPIQAMLGELHDCPQFLGSGHVLLVVQHLPDQNGESWFAVRDSNRNSTKAEASYSGLLQGLTYGPWVASWTGL
jgi:hypothetical protein